jgi:hypothetical protein
VEQRQSFAVFDQYAKLFKDVEGFFHDPLADVLVEPGHAQSGGHDGPSNRVTRGAATGP